MYIISVMSKSQSLMIRISFLILLLSFVMVNSNSLIAKICAHVQAVLLENMAHHKLSISLKFWDAFQCVSGFKSECSFEHSSFFGAMFENRFSVLNFHVKSIEPLIPCVYGWS